MISEKDKYRGYFIKMKKYVKYAPILEEINVPSSNFSQFLTQSNNYALSLKKLQMIKQRMDEIFSTEIEEDMNDKNIQ